MNKTDGNPNSGTNLPQLRRLHYWLSYNRYSIVIFGGGFYLPAEVLMAILIPLAVIFAPYVLYVLYRNHKNGWLVFFAILVGIPTVLAFLSTGNFVLDTGLHFLPLLTFYVYCFLLRLAVDDWISDVSYVDQLWTEEQNKQNKLDL